MPDQAVVDDSLEVQQLIHIQDTSEPTSPTRIRNGYAGRIHPLSRQEQVRAAKLDFKPAAEKILAEVPEAGFGG